MNVHVCTYSCPPLSMGTIYSGSRCAERFSCVTPHDPHSSPVSGSVITDPWFVCIHSTNKYLSACCVPGIVLASWATEVRVAALLSLICRGTAGGQPQRLVVAGGWLLHTQLLPLAFSTPATLASLLFLELGHTPASGPLHLLFSPARCLSC